MVLGELHTDRRVLCCKPDMTNTIENGMYQIYDILNSICHLIFP